MATADQLREEYAKISKKNQEAYDALHGQFGTQNVERDYRIAKRDNDKEAIARLKPEFDRLTAAYKATQEEKNRKKDELDAAVKAENKAKLEAAKTKGASNVYQKALDELQNAEINVYGYNGEKAYADAYNKVVAAAKTLSDSGKPTVVPPPVIPVKPIQPSGDQGGAGGDKGKNLTVQDITNLITTKGNEDLLKKYQIALQPFGYKGNTQGKPDASIVTALEKASASYGSIPGNWKANAGNFQDWIFNPSIQGVAFQAPGSGTGTGVTPTVSRTDPTSAAALVENEIKTSLGRDATTAEISALTKALNTIEDANPKNRLGTAGGQYTYVGGVNPAEIIRQLVNNPNNIDFASWNIKNKKVINDIKKGVTTLDLASQVLKRKEDKTVKSLEAIKQTAINNGLTLDATKLGEYQQRLANGEDPAAIQKSIRDIVAQTMPKNVQDLMAAGNNLSDVYQPYRQSAASILEMPIDSIKFNDPVLTKAIGPDGNMPLYQFQQELRKDPRWQYTNNARQAVSESVLKVLQDFGFKG